MSFFNQIISVLVISGILAVASKQNSELNSKKEVVQQPGKLEIFPEKIYITPDGSEVMLNVANSGKEPIKLQKGAMWTFVEVSEANKEVVLKIEKVEVRLEQFELVFSPTEMNVVVLNPNEYTELVVSNFGVGNTVPNFPLLQRAVEMNYDFLISFSGRKEMGELSDLWSGKLEIEVDSSQIFLSNEGKKTGQTRKGTRDR